MDVTDQLAGLRSLADDATVASTPPVPSTLWDRGRRAHRLQQRGTVLIATLGVVLFLALGAWGLQRATPVKPASTPIGEIGIPDRVFSVPRWLPVGAPQTPAIAVMTADRGTWWGDERRLVAISATTGEYFFLDIPALSNDQDFALSPDGRYLAYWSAGTPSGQPNTAFGQVDEPITGLTVYSMMDGAEQFHHDVPTEHGIEPNGLLWADPTTLVFTFGQLRAGDNGTATDQSSSTMARAFVWPLGQEPQRRRLAGLDEVDDFAAAHGGVIFSEGRLIDLSANTSRRVLGPSGNLLRFRADPNLGRDGVIVAIGGPGNISRFPNSVAYAKIPARGSSAQVRDLPGTQNTVQVLGWRNELLVVSRWPNGSDGNLRIQTVDTATGDRQTLVRAPRSAQWQWAEELLDAKVVAGVEPPAPVDPRLLVAGGLTILLAAGWAIVAWRRRVRA